MTDWFREEWLPIEGFSNYEISNKGNVRTVQTHRLINTNHTSRGVSVKLHNEKYSQTLRVDVLVAETFIGLADDNYILKHIDNNIFNNYVNNLEWIQKSRLKTKRELYRTSRVRCKETGEIFDSIYECSEVMNISIQTLRRCLNYSYLKTCDGYSFEFLDLESEY